MNKQKRKELDLFKTQKIDGNRIANTSIKSYNSEATKATREKYWTQIVNYLIDNPSRTSRQIAKALNIERTTLTGVLRKMQDVKLIYISTIVVCNHSNREVRCYSIVTKETKATAERQLLEDREKKAERAKQRRLRYLEDRDNEAA